MAINKLSQRLKMLRKEMDLSQYELSERLNIPRGNIGNYEIGAREPDYDTLGIFAEFYDVSCDYLLGFTNLRQRTLSPGQAQRFGELLVTLSDLSDEEISCFKTYVDKSEVLKDIGQLSSESISDLKRYISLLKLRDGIPNEE